MLVGKVDLGGLFNCVDNPVLGEPGSGNRTKRGIVAFAPAKQQLVVFQPLFVDAKNPDVAGVMVPASVDAARNLELELTEFGAARREPLAELLRNRDLAGIGQAAIVEPRTGDDIVHRV